MENVPLLKFGADWSVEQSAPLVAGGQVVVRYYRARLAGQEQLDQGGEHNWVLSGFCSLNGGLSHIFKMGGRSSDETAEQVLALPEGGNLELWFERSDRYGEHKFDSDYGRNFCFAVQPQTAGVEVRSEVPVQVHGRRPTKGLGVG